MPIDQSFYAWYTLGWTNQNKKPYVPGSEGGVIVAPGVPADISIITITGTYVDLNGTALNGYVLFTPMVTRLTDPANVTVVLPTQIRADVVAGHLVQYHTQTVAFALPASNDPDVIPAGGFQYYVQEIVPGGVKGVLVTVPYNASGGTVDISALIAGSV